MELCHIQTQLLTIIPPIDVEMLSHLKIILIDVPKDVSNSEYLDSLIFMAPLPMRVKL